MLHDKICYPNNTNFISLFNSQKIIKMENFIMLDTYRTLRVLRLMFKTHMRLFLLKEKLRRKDKYCIAFFNFSEILVYQAKLHPQDSDVIVKYYVKNMT